MDERLRRGSLIRDEGRRTDRPPDPGATLQTSLTNINYFVERNGHDAAERGDNPPRLPASFTPINAWGKSSTLSLSLSPQSEGVMNNLAPRMLYLSSITIIIIYMTVPATK